MPCVTAFLDEIALPTSVAGPVCLGFDLGIGTLDNGKNHLD